MCIFTNIQNSSYKYSKYLLIQNEYKPKSVNRAIFKHHYERWFTGPRLQYTYTSYLSSSVCCARSCCAAARAAIPSAKLGWQASIPRPSSAGCCSRSSATGWPPALLTASTGGRGGWKAGEACCFLVSVLPLRGLCSINLLAELKGKETVKTPQVQRWSQVSNTKHRTGQGKSICKKKKSAYALNTHGEAECYRIIQYQQCMELN